MDDTLCGNSKCPWLNGTSGKDDILECNNNKNCNTGSNGFNCCDSN